MSNSIGSNCQKCRKCKMEKLLVQPIVGIPLIPLIPPELKGKTAVICKCNVCGYIEVYLED